MSKVIKKSTRIFTLSLCIALLLTNTLILAPEVGAARDTNRTETLMKTNSNISTAEDDVLTQRAIAIDEAKKEAQAAVSEQLAIIAQEEEDALKEEETETLQSEAKEPDNSAAKDSIAETSEDNYSDDSAESSSTSDDDEDYDSGNSYAQTSGDSNYLLSIDNPDYDYVSYSVSMSDADRDYCERMVMGEAGSMGFEGMALVAQCIRDTFVSGGYSSVTEAIQSNGYYGSTSITPSSACKEAVSYIFDQGGAAVQHTISVFYASNYCTSAWHEAQEYVCSYGYVRFFAI